MSDQQPPAQPTIKQQRDLKQEMKEQKRNEARRQEKTKNIITWSIVGVVIAGIMTLIVISAQGGGSVNANVAAVDATVDHVQGSSDAKAVLIEYSDYQCPACGAYYPLVKQMQEKYGDKLALVYRNYPLTSLHQYAQLGAQAAEAAGLQDKYWEMHDKLFDNQDDWVKAGDVKQKLIDYAKELKLDEKKFKGDLDSSTVKTRVQRDIDSGNAVSVNSTPTFYLNGKKITNPVGADAFSKVIDGVLAGS